MRSKLIDWQATTARKEPSFMMTMPSRSSEIIRVAWVEIGFSMTLGAGAVTAEPMVCGAGGVATAPGMLGVPEVAGAGGIAGADSGVGSGLEPGAMAAPVMLVGIGFTACMARR